MTTAAIVALLLVLMRGAWLFLKDLRRDKFQSISSRTVADQVEMKQLHEKTLIAKEAYEKALADLPADLRPDTSRPD